MCGVLCVAGLVFGVVYGYAARVLFNPVTFSERVGESLGQPDVARVVAEQVVDQIIASRRELTAYRPLLLGTVEYVVASAPFRAVVRRAAREAHATLISSRGENILLTVSDLGVVVRNALSAYPELAAKIPARANVVLSGMDDWPASKRLVSLLQVGYRLKVQAWVGLAVGVLGGVGGLLLARRRDRYLLRLGVGLTITSFVLAVVTRFGGEVAARVASTPVASDLLRGLWPVFVGPLQLRMVVLGAFGLVLVAAVTSWLEKLDLLALADEVWDHAGRRRLGARWGIVRGAVFIAAGGVVVMRPAQTVEVLAAVGGAVLFFLGVRELFTTAIRFAPRVESVLTRRERDPDSPWPEIAVVAALVLILGGAGTFWALRQDAATARPAGAISACNGYPELCDRPLNEVAFATTHNSMAAADIDDWMFPNQERGLRRQFEDGVRGFLVDVHYGVPVGGRIKTQIENEEAARAKYEASLGKEGVDAALRIRNRLVGKETGPRDVYLGHGFCELGATRFVDALQEMRDVLVANPGEVVIIIIQDEGVTPADVADCFARSGLEDLVYRGAVTPPWPTLRELIERDERVLVFAENQAQGVPWYHLAFEVFQETPYRFLDPSQFSNQPGRGGRSGSLLLMNHWIETLPAPRPSNAEIVNAAGVLLPRALACREERGMMPNLIAVDFYRTGDLLKVVRALNGLPEPVEAPTP
jgi:hypothetical protein